MAWVVAVAVGHRLTKHLLIYVKKLKIRRAACYAISGDFRVVAAGRGLSIVTFFGGLGGTAALVLPLVIVTALVMHRVSRDRKQVLPPHARRSAHVRRRGNPSAAARRISAWLTCWPAEPWCACILCGITDGRPTCASWVGPKAHIPGDQLWRRLVIGRMIHLDQPCAGATAKSLDRPVAVVAPRRKDCRDPGARRP